VTTFIHDSPSYCYWEGPGDEAIGAMQLESGVDADATPSDIRDEVQRSASYSPKSDVRYLINVASD
jgi:hypothetical protein